MASHSLAKTVIFYLVAMIMIMFHVVFEILLQVKWN